jgi:hypothetical protein
MADLSPYQVSGTNNTSRQVSKDFWNNFIVAVEAAIDAAEADIAAVEAEIDALEIARGTALNVQLDFGAVGDGVTDDTEAIQAAIDAAEAAGGSRDVWFPTPAAGGFYKCDGQLDCSETTGIALRSEGNRVEPTQDLAPCALVYTGTADQFILAGGSHGLTIDGLAIQTNNASFTGDLVSLDEFPASGETTYSTHIVNCQFGGRTSAARFAQSCINAQGAVELFVDLCTFGYADQHIIAKSPTGVRAWSNAVTITRNRFVEHNNYALNIYSAIQWIIQNNVFEYSYGTAGAGNAAGITDLLVGGTTERSSQGIQISGNGFWDAESGTWIDIYGFGHSITDNWTDLLDGATFLTFNSGVGAKVSGNVARGSAGATFITNAGALMPNLADDGTNLVDGAVTYNAATASFSPIDRTLKDVTARNLDVHAVLGTGGAVHVRKPVAADLVGGSVLIDRNDDTDWRGAALFSIFDSTLAKECLALAVSNSTTTPLDLGKIRALLTEDGDLKLAGTKILIGSDQVVGTRGAAVADAAALTSVDGTNAVAAPTQAEFNALVAEFNKLRVDVAAVRTPLNASLARQRAHGLIAT